MTTLRVVEQLDVVEDVPPGFFPVVIGFSLDALPLQQLEEARRNRIVVAIPAPSHARHQTMRLQEVLPVITAELASLIGMHEHLLRGLASPYRHPQGIQDQLPVDA